MPLRTTIGYYPIKKSMLLAACFLLFSCFSFSQTHLDSLLQKTDPQKWAASIGKRADKLEAKLISKSEKTLHKLERQEEKIYRKMLDGPDSLKAKAALADSRNKYATLEDK